VVADTGRCIGCGLCVTTCPAAASKMILRKKDGKLSRTYAELCKKIQREALVSLVKRKISEKMTGLIAKHSSNR
jgi:Fe-S-cluster-containing hydrogenase component 2